MSPSASASAPHLVVLRPRQLSFGLLEPHHSRLDLPPQLVLLPPQAIPLRLQGPQLAHEHGAVSKLHTKDITERKSLLLYIIT